MKYPAVQRWLVQNTPLEPTLLEGNGFESVVGERLNATGHADASDYIRELERSADEVYRLTAGIAVPETWFFRYPHSYRLLAGFLERRLARGTTSVAMASVGCAGGEEPLSMAMVAHHAGLTPASVRILAMDCSPDALRRARAGEYGPGSLRTEIPLWAAGYIRHCGPVVTVDPAVRSMVQFIHADVTAPEVFGPGAQLDVIFCRNLLIYLKTRARHELMDALVAALASDGLLFVGHAEPLLCVRPGLRPVAVEQTFCLERTTEPATPPQPRRFPRSAAPVPAAQPIRRPASRAAPQPLVMPTQPDAHPASMLDAARELADAGQLAECESLLRGLLARQGPSADALELLGLVRIAAKDTAEARTCFEQAVYLDPLRATSIIQLAMIYEGRGDQRRAAAYWNRAKRASAAGSGEPSK